MLVVLDELVLDDDGDDPAEPGKLLPLLVLLVPTDDEGKLLLLPPLAPPPAPMLEPKPPLDELVWSRSGLNGISEVITDVWWPPPPKLTEEPPLLLLCVWPPCGSDDSGNDMPVVGPERNSTFC